MRIRRMRKLQIPKDSKLLFYIFWGFEFYRLIIKLLCTILNIAEWTETVCVLFVILVCFFVLRSLISQIKYYHILIYIMLIVIYGLQYVLYPDVSKWLNAFFPSTVFLVFPFVLFGASFCEINLEMNALSSISKFIIAFMLAKYLFYTSTVVIDEQIFSAYRVLPHVMCVSLMVLEKKRMSDFIFAIVGIFLLIVFAARGPILLYVLYLAYNLYCIGIASRLILLLCAIAAWIFLETDFGYMIIKVMANTMGGNGFSTRIFDMLLSNQITYDNGRKFIQRQVMVYVNKHPKTGNGWFSDRMATSFSGKEVIKHGVRARYAHNIFLEFWCDYGYLIGSILLIIVVLLFIYAYRQLMDTQRKIFLILLFSSFFKLVMSGSYLEQNEFWLLLGISITVCHSSVQRIKAK